MRINKKGFQIGMATIWLKGYQFADMVCIVSSRQPVFDRRTSNAERVRSQALWLHNICVRKREKPVSGRILISEEVIKVTTLTTISN